MLQTVLEDRGVTSKDAGMRAYFLWNGVFPLTPLLRIAGLAERRSPLRIRLGSVILLPQAGTAPHLPTGSLKAEHDRPRTSLAFGTDYWNAAPGWLFTGPLAE